MPGGFNLYSICIIFYSRVQLFIEPESFDTVWPFLESNRSAQCGAPTCFSKQDKKKISRVCEAVRKEYAIVKDYENDWPVRDMLQLHLKYTTEASC